MGHPTTLQDAAPAYEDVFNDHPVNRNAPSGSASSYAAIPQNDDVELGHNHSHTSPEAQTSSTPPETLAQTIAGVFRPKPHVHCEQCDIQVAAQQRRENEKHCCNMVAATFITLFICAALFGIIFTSILHGKRNRHGP